jgi:carboxylesterase
MMAVLPQVKVPALLVQSRLDKVIPPTSMDEIYEKIGSAEKTRLWVENSGHVVTREPDRELIFKKTSDFIRRVTG